MRKIVEGRVCSVTPGCNGDIMYENCPRPFYKTESTPKRRKKNVAVTIRYVCSVCNKIHLSDENGDVGKKKMECFKNF